MGFSEKLAARIRERLVDQPDVEEKKMFRGMCFMVSGKMCICVSANEIMCRIDPVVYETAVHGDGCRAMVRDGKPLVGFVFVAEEAVENKRDLDYWIDLCLDFNPRAEATKPKKKK